MPCFFDLQKTPAVTMRCSVRKRCCCLVFSEYGHRQVVKAYTAPGFSVQCSSFNFDYDVAAARAGSEVFVSEPCCKSGFALLVYMPERSRMAMPLAEYQSTLQTK